MFLTTQPLAISPTASETTPMASVRRHPILRVTLAVMMAKKEMLAAQMDPTKAMVEAEPTPSSTSWAWMTPKE